VWGGGVILRENFFWASAKVNYFFLAPQEFFLFLHYKGMQEVCKHIFFFTPGTEHIFFPAELGIRNKKKNLSAHNFVFHFLYEI
jgi:hypothetical protein